MLSNITNIAQLELQMYAQAKPLSARQDVRRYFSECLRESDQLYDQAVDLLLSKGIHVRTPIIDTPDQVDYVSKQGFFSDGLESKDLYLAWKLPTFMRTRSGMPLGCI